MRRSTPCCVLALVSLASCKSTGNNATLRDSAPVVAETGSETDDALLAGAAPSLSLAKILARAQQRTYWPGLDGDWKLAADATTTMASANCQDFAAYLFPPAGTDEATAKAKGIKTSALKDTDQALRTDGAIVIKGGEVVWEQYAGGYAGHPERLHPMWSASKSFTTAVAGAVALLSDRAAKGETVDGAKLMPDGKAFGLSTAIGGLLDPGLNSDPRFAQLTVGQLLNMSPNLHWLETYEADVRTSNVARMIWLEGLSDMTAYAARQPFGPEGPGQKFNYSSGNAVMVMAALKKLYGDQYDHMPWQVLFDRIGMKHVTFERDQQGVFVGSSYVHTTLRDMAKLGYLYLNGGYYGKEQVLQPDFYRAARQLSPSMIATGTSEENIEEEGSYYSLGWWINPDPKDLASVRPMKRPGKFFPNSPSDVIFAAGHYGQIIIIFPQEDLLVVKMSHDAEYFSKLDNIMSKARRCFVPAAH